MPEQPKKLDLTSMDVTEDKKQKLKQLFPEVFREDKIDFDHLKRVLGEWVPEKGRERFGLQWPGKAECMKIIQQPSIATLKPNREESVNFDNTENLFIEGDNLEVLKLLQKSYFGKVKMIYIDPPYNTGNEFIYPDDYGENLNTYLEYTGQKDGEGNWQTSNKETEGRFHSKWLNMMYPRLFLAKNLLQKDGVIFISIDDHEVNNLVKICEEIFGEENHLATIANINNPKGRSDDKHFATAHEYILAFAKNVTKVDLKGFEPGEKITKRYNKVDENGFKYREIDLRKTGDADLREDRPDMFYYFYYDEQEEELIISKEKKELKGFREIIPLREDGREGRWRWGYDTASERIDELIARFMPNREIWGVFEKDYLKDRDTVTPTTSWTFKNVNSERGSEQFINLGFRKEIFPRPKPVGTLKRLLQIGASDDDIVLDFFSGSCSMAEAILRKNTEENTSIKYILVQLPEKCEEDSIPYKEGFNTISEIGKERIRRVGNKISQGELDLEESQTELELEPSNQESQSHDLGFKVFKLDKSNFKVWDSPEVDIDPGDLEEQLDVFADHISPEAEQESILYELILKSGYPLTTSIEEKELDGKTIYSIHDDALLIYLDDDLTFEILDQMAEMEPNRVVCLDKSFSGEQADALKTNAVQLFKSHDIAFRTV